MANHQATGFTRIIKAAVYSWKGIKAAWKHEAAFRQEIVVFIFAILFVSYLELDTIQRILLIGSLVLVLIIEMLNSAIEAIVDRIGPEYHELSGRAKDMGSAAVLIAMLLALFVWSIILYHYFS